MASVFDPIKAGIRRIFDTFFQPEPDPDEQAQQAIQISGSSHYDSFLDVAVQPLSVITPPNEVRSIPAVSSEDLTMTSSEMVALRYEDGLRAAIVLSPELLRAFAISQDAVLEAGYQTQVLKAKDKVLREYGERVKSRGQYHLTRSLQWRINFLEEKLEQVDDKRAEIEEPLKSARNISRQKHCIVATQLQHLFESNGVVQPDYDRLEKYQPDDSFLQERRVPEPVQDSNHDNDLIDDDDMPTRDDSGYADRQSRGRKRSLRSRSRSASLRGERSDSYRYRSQPPQRRRSPSPREKAENELDASGLRILGRRQDFEMMQNWMKEKPAKESASDTSSAAEFR